MIDLQAALNPLVAAKDAEIARLQGIIDRIAPGELGVPTGQAIIPWDKYGYVGHALDLTGYVETFREDFDDPSHLTDESGNGPIFSPVHTDFGAVTFRKPSDNSGVYSVADSKLRIRTQPYVWKATVGGVLRTWSKADYPGDPVAVTGGWLFDGNTTATKPNITRTWESGHIQTLTRDGRGFHQPMGVWEYRCSYPPAPGGGAAGYWGGGWNLSANEFVESIGGHMWEFDYPEIYGGAARLHHISIHKKAKKHPLPEDFLQSGDRETLSCQVDTVAAKYTDNPTQLLYPNGLIGNLMDGNPHLYAAKWDEEWLTTYYDGLSICRYPMREFMKSPGYFNFSSVLNSSPLTSAPLDCYLDYVRALAKA